MNSDGDIVVRNVPARICTQCGEEWIADEIAEKLETVAETARKEKKQVEVVDFALTVAADELVTRIRQTRNPDAFKQFDELCARLNRVTSPEPSSENNRTIYGN